MHPAGVEATRGPGDTERPDGRGGGTRRVVLTGDDGGAAEDRFEVYDFVAFVNGLNGKRFSITEQGRREDRPACIICGGL